MEIAPKEALEASLGIIFFSYASQRAKNMIWAAWFLGSLR